MKCPGTSDGDPYGDAVCTNNQCAIQCHANYTKCSNNTCVDTANDPKNCGTCGHDCTALAQRRHGHGHQVFVWKVRRP